MRSRKRLLVGARGRRGVAGREGGPQPLEGLGKLGFELGDMTHLFALSIGSDPF